ncbi:MAG: hypothetical protein HY800_04885 [Ignavibacteriales bacterium]|nr:hypothetical protein [Ignavibacteriales bacterium]
MVLTFLKILSDNQELKKINQKDFQSFIDSEFKNSDRVKRIAQYTRVSKINEMINFLKQNNKYHDCFKSINLETFLKSRIRVQINLINAIKEGIGGTLDEYSVGTLIAEANNDTQKVKVDDIFGNKYRKDLEEKLFNKFIGENKGKVNIEYRYGEVTGKGEKVHILTLLRPVVATGILTKEKDIFLMTNQRDPIYRLFEKFLSKGFSGETINAIKKLIPYLYDLRKKYVEVILEQHKRDLIREYKEKAISEELGDTIISDDIGAAQGDDGKIEKIMRTAVNYNIEHIIPVFVFRIRKLFIETSDSEKLDLIIPAAKRDAFFKSLIKAIYDNYVKMRLKGLSTSLTTEVRSRKFYDFGTEAYTVWKEQENLKETDYIERHRHVLS